MKVKPFKMRFLICLSLCFICESVNSHHGNSGIHIQRLGEFSEKLDDDGKFMVYWSISKDKESVTFDLIAETTGFVGFGITLDGSGNGADVFIGGVQSTGSEHGTIYSGDYHGSSTGEFFQDRKNSWGVLDGSENSTHTYLRVIRRRHTCDSEDIQIPDEGTTRIFWILGKDDEGIEKWKENPQGSKFANIMPLYVPNVDMSQYKTWDIYSNTKYPDTGHAHWCVIRPGPKGPGKLHIVGYEAIFGSKEAKDHTHHHTIRYCTPPPGKSAEEFFGAYSESAGADCYNNNHTFPTDYCKGGLITLLTGGKRVVMPEKYGQPLRNNGFYLFVLHYSNPDQVRFISGLRVFYTEQPREHDAHRIIITTDVSEQGIVVPPQSTAFGVTSHFPPACIPRGFTIYNVLLHAHHAGRKLRLRHFRNDKELPWIIYDDFYNAYYQQNKNLLKERDVLPGDHLMMECEMGAEEEVVLGEMCVAVIYAHTVDDVKPKYLESQSRVEVDKQLGLLGITNQTTTFDGEHMETIIHEPASLRGELKDVLSHRYKWTPEILQKFQHLYIYEPQHQVCVAETYHHVTTDASKLLPKYSNVKTPTSGVEHPYHKPSPCQASGDHHHHNHLYTNRMFPFLSAM